MAGGFEFLPMTFAFDNEDPIMRAREKAGYGENPIFGRLNRQFQANLDPRKQRRQLRRSYSNVRSGIDRATNQAVGGLNESLAARGLGSSGIGAAAEGDIRFQGAAQQAQLPAMFQEALLQRQQQARQEALGFLNDIMQQRINLALAHKGVKGVTGEARGEGLGIAGGIAGILGSLGKAAGGIAGIPGLF